MNELQTTATITEVSTDVQDLELETFQVEELTELDVNAALAVDISLCSSTTSSSCG